MGPPALVARRTPPWLRTRRRGRAAGCAQGHPAERERAGGARRDAGDADRAGRPGQGPGAAGRRVHDLRVGPVRAGRPRACVGRPGASARRLPALSERGSPAAHRWLPDWEGEHSLRGCIVCAVRMLGHGRQGRGRCRQARTRRGAPRAAGRRRSTWRWQAGCRAGSSSPARRSRWAATRTRCRRARPCRTPAWV